MSIRLEKKHGKKKCNFFKLSENQIKSHEVAFFYVQNNVDLINYDINK